MIRRMKLVLFVLLIISATGCASLGVEPWERDLLAKPVDSALDDHIYFSKEASSGGRGVGGIGKPG